MMSVALKHVWQTIAACLIERSVKAAGVSFKFVPLQWTHLKSEMSVDVTVSPLLSAPNRIGKSDAPVNKYWVLVSNTRSHLRLTGSAAFNRRIKNWRICSEKYSR
jgi:hypothetical protein